MMRNSVLSAFCFNLLFFIQRETSWRQSLSWSSGTPQEVGSMSEKQLPILMACRISVRYEVNLLTAVPDIPYHVDKRVMRIYWIISCVCYLPHTID